MEAHVSVPEPPIQAIKLLIQKSKSTKPTTSASKKTLIGKTTKSPYEGSVMVVVSGDEKCENRQNLRDKIEELSENQPSPIVPSQRFKC